MQGCLFNMFVITSIVSRTKQLWTEEQDMELTRLFEQYKDAHEDGKIEVGLKL